MNSTIYDKIIHSSIPHQVICDKIKIENNGKILYLEKRSSSDALFYELFLERGREQGMIDCLEDLETLLEEELNIVFSNKVNSKY